MKGHNKVKNMGVGHISNISVYYISYGMQTNKEEFSYEKSQTLS